MPRILGQKKLRESKEEHQTEGDSLTLHNSITAQELFTRHPELAVFLLDRLKDPDQTILSNPSLVPILSMLSRVSPGIQMIK
jgi:hypothetical protein